MWVQYVGALEKQMRILPQAARNPQGGDDDYCCCVHIGITHCFTPIFEQQFIGENKLIYCLRTLHKINDAVGRAFAPKFGRRCCRRRCTPSAAATTTQQQQQHFSAARQQSVDAAGDNGCCLVKALISNLMLAFTT
uniref:Uncharacterized protein n=1 Tax=Globodera rostochiensis TaxID=31243 RepID=A0A914GZD1_GLORO